jgi:small-conductance mechanosensitive channel/CRP-like cAMP-binding protein
VPSFEELNAAVAPLVPGLVTAGVFIISLVGLRLLLRHERARDKLRLPARLLVFYVALAVVVVLARLYWPAGYGVLSAVALLVLGLAVILAVSFGLFDLFLGRYRRVEVPRILRDVVIGVVYVVTVFVVLGRHGFDLSSILTTSAVLTAVIGFSLQDLLGSIASGLALQIERPFAVGDWVQFNDQEGRVLEMNWRSTKILTRHHDVVVIPNNVITRQPVINFTSPDPVHRQRLEISLRYDTPPNVAKQAILRALCGTDGVLGEPQPSVWLRRFGESGIEYRMQFYIDEFARRDTIADEVATRVWYQLHRDGLQVPFPTREVNLQRAEDHRAERDAEHEAERERVIQMLRRVPFLEPLSLREQQQLAARIRPMVYASGETVIRQGDEGDSFYVIADGEVEVRVGAGEQEQVVARLHTGDYFGEMSLMTGEVRTATVVTCCDSQFYLISKRAFESLIAAHEALIEAIGAKLEARRAELEATRSRGGGGGAAPRTDLQSLVGRIRRFFNLGA